MVKDALLIAKKDFKSHRTGIGCAAFSAALVLASCCCAAVGAESPFMANPVCWLVFPLSIGPLAAVPAGSRMLAAETETNMLEVLLTSGTSPLAFVCGKALKPIAWGVATALLAYAAAQTGFLLSPDHQYLLYGLGAPFVLVGLSGTVAASLFLTAFSIALANESLYSAAAMCISVAPTLALCNAYAMLGFASPVEAMPLVLLANCTLCLLGLVIATRLLRPGSFFRVTNS